MHNPPDGPTALAIESFQTGTEDAARADFDRYRANGGRGLSLDIVQQLGPDDRLPCHANFEWSRLTDIARHLGIGTFTANVKYSPDDDMLQSEAARRNRYPLNQGVVVNALRADSPAHDSVDYHKDVGGQREPSDQTIFVSPLSKAITDILRLQTVLPLDEQPRVLVVGDPTSRHMQHLAKWLTGHQVQNNLFGDIPANPNNRTLPLRRAVAQADIVVLAANRPGLVIPKMLRAGQLVIDVGETATRNPGNGYLVAGDLHPSIAESHKKVWYTAPGVIGRLAAWLTFRNLANAPQLTLADRSAKPV